MTTRKRIWSTLLLLSIVAATILPVSAATGVQTTIYYRDIKIEIDGTQITPTDANGKVVEPFVMDGTTYLPVRAVSGALGLDVGWDGATSTVSLTTKAEDRQVYITRTGAKYHYSDSCNGGTYWPVPLSTATGMGLTPCDKCVN